MTKKMPAMRKAAQRTAKTDVVTGIPAETISQRAYTLFQARGSTHGHDVEDWLVAEAELQNGTNTEVTSPSADTLRRLG